MNSIVSPTTAQLDGLVASYTQSQPGLAFAIGWLSPQIDGSGPYRHGGLYFSGQVMNQYGATLPLGPDTRFELASLSKTFTATLYAALLPGYVARTRIGDPVLSDLYDGMALPTLPPDIGAIPLRALVSYVSGLRQDNGTAVAPPHLQGCGMSLANLCGFLDMDVAFAPHGTGKRYTYSNLAFALAGEAMGQMAGVPDASYRQVLYRNVTVPLGMLDTTTFDHTLLSQLPIGFGATGKGGFFRAAPGWPMLPSYNGAGGVVSTPRDLMRWLNFNMGMSANPTLSALLARTQVPATTVTDGDGDALGLGWFLGDDGVVWKDGEIQGCNTYLALLASGQPGVVPSAAGVVVASNVSGLMADNQEVVQEVALRVLAIMQGRDPASLRRPRRRGYLPQVAA